MSQIIYYAEINIISIVILFFLLIQISRRGTDNQRPSILMIHMIIAVFINCICDFVEVYYRGKLFVGARSIVEICNILYFISASACTYLWFIYVINEIDERKNTRKLRIISGIPLIFINLSFLINPYTNFYFSINNENLYHREGGILLYWIITILYVIVATSYAHYYLLSATNPLKREKYQSLLKFTAPAAAGCIVQFMFYGVTSNQIGIVLSLLLVFLDTETSMILKDETTGLNNRRALIKYVFETIEKMYSAKFSVIFISHQNLKEISSVYGRKERDEALHAISRLLMFSLRDFPKRAGIYRYSRNEFVIIGSDFSVADIEEAVNKIETELDIFNKESEKSYKLDLKIGSATNDVYDEKDFSELMQTAEEVAFIN